MVLSGLHGGLCLAPAVKQTSHSSDRRLLILVRYVWQITNPGEPFDWVADRSASHKRLTCAF